LQQAFLPNFEDIQVNDFKNMEFKEEKKNLEKLRKQIKKLSKKKNPAIK